MERFKSFKKQALKDYIKSKGIGKISGNKAALLAVIEKSITPISSPISDPPISADPEVINLTGAQKKKIDLGGLIINIYNAGQNLPVHPDIQHYANQAARLPEEQKHDILQHFKPHIKSAKKEAKKFPKVDTGVVGGVPKVSNIPVSAKSQKSKDKIKAELSKLKPSVGHQSDFKKTLEGLFGGN